MRVLGAVVLLAALGGRASFARAEDLAVVVNPRNPVSALSASELREIVLLEQQHWRRGGRIHVLLPETGTPAKDLLLRRALRMSEDQLRRHYLAKLYSGDIPAFPLTVATSARSRQLLRDAAGGLGFIDASAVDATVKALTIDGRRPGDAGYLLSR